MNKKMNKKFLTLIICSILIALPSIQITSNASPFEHFPPKINNREIQNKNDIDPIPFINLLSWPLIYDRNMEDVSQNIILDSDENIIVTGYTGINISYGTDFLTLKYDHEGNLLWDVTYDGGENDYAWDIAIDSEDNIIIYGFNSTLGAQDITEMDMTFFLIKYSSDGEKIWNKTLKWEDDCFPGGITVDSQNNIIMTLGIGDFDTMALFCYTMKMDEDGNELWNTTYLDDMISIGFEVVTNEDDDIFVGGLAASFFGQGWLIVNYDSSGNQQWRSHLNRGNNLNDFDIDHEGNLVLTGQHYSQETNSSFWLTIKCDPDGDEVWEYSYDGIYHEYAQDATIDSMGNVIALGPIIHDDIFEDLIIICDSLGQELCMKKHTFDGSLLSVAVDEDDTIFASGVIETYDGGYNADSYICKFVDITPPSVESFYPESGYLYLGDSQLFPFFGNTVIVGSITLSATVTDPDDVEKTIFYVNGIEQASISSPPYEWVWDETGFGRYTVEIHVYDAFENIKRETITSWKVF